MSSENPLHIHASEASPHAQHPITHLVRRHSGVLRHMNAVFRTLPEGRIKYAQQYAFLADDIVQLPPFDLSAHAMCAIWNDNVDVFAPVPTDDFNDSRHPWYILARVIGTTYMIGTHEVEIRQSFTNEVFKPHDEVDLSNIDYDARAVSDRVAELLTSFNGLKSLDAEQASPMPLPDIIETWANGITPLYIRFDRSNTLHRS